MNGENTFPLKLWPFIFTLCIKRLGRDWPTSPYDWQVGSVLDCILTHELVRDSFHPRIHRMYPIGDLVSPRIIEQDTDIMGYHIPVKVGVWAYEESNFLNIHVQ